MRAPDTGQHLPKNSAPTGENRTARRSTTSGFSWDPVHNVTAGPAFIKQFVTLEKGGDKYTGVVTIIQYKADGKTVDIELKGVIAASRV